MTDTRARLSDALADRYRIERELGAGGMATVYLAHDVRHNRRVALKVLRPELAAVIGGDRFLKEIETTANLQHPHILPLFDSGQVDGTVFYVMPFVEGESLRDRIAREKLLPVPDATRIASEVAGALDYAHRRGVIHRDIKPENILLHDGRALIADFGIALAASRTDGSTRLTETGMSLGTPHYMSPEQAMGERALDARTDVYALGCVLYEMLAGEPPFSGPTAQAIIARVMTEEPRSLTVQRRAVPPHVEAAVLQALEKLPADRFASAAQFADALGAHPATGVRTVAVAPPAGRWRTLTFALGGAAVALAALAAWGWLRPRPSAGVVRYRVALDSLAIGNLTLGMLALSPDGATIVHTGGPGGVLVARRRDALDWRPIPGTAGAEAPFFSPDGSQLAYAAAGSLWVTNLSGAPPIELADSVIGPQAAVWTEGGEIIGLVRKGAFEGLTRMRATAGARLEAVTVVDTAAGEREHLAPALLPGGRHVLFSVSYHPSGNNRLYAIAVADLETGTHRVLLPGVRARYSSSGHLVYSTGDGRLLAAPFDPRTLTVGEPSVVIAQGLRSFIIGPFDFDVSPTGTLVYAMGEAGDNRELVWVTRDGQESQVDPSWRGRFESPALSPDGARAAVVMSHRSSSEIFVKQLDRGPSVRLTFEGRFSGNPTWRPDGRAITYHAGGGTAGALWTKRDDGSARPQLQLEMDRDLSEAAWSPDGRWLAVRTTTPTAGAGDILALRPGVDTAPIPLLHSRFPEYTPTFSPDGRYLAYSSSESGRFEVYVVPFPDVTSAKWQVSTQGGYEPRWSPNGRELFYRDAAMQLVATEVTTTPTFSSGRTTSLFDAGGFTTLSFSRRSYDVSRDGNRFLFVRPVPGARGDHLVVVEHWFEDLARQRQE